ncbi:hypothetical protein [Brachybacterium kimchii]|uniref:Alpha/beta hydrolase n=1 Tax=Brachybacterium kimchii TaxID=2942909 RepID=A0ABY4N438_9MICO|nr:hypothetical protein [Brachybacterium kimchii]UQN28084.1 hypothetical protein M4486_10500 [Brachybacterium kimchii]
MNVNKTTGLHETRHPKYKVPVVHQEDLDALRFEGYPLAIHTVPAADVPSVDFYAKLEPSDELYVSLHGAVDPGPARYPHFRRVESMRDRVSAFLSIADPTLELSEREDFGIGWYTGGPGWDPMDAVESIVRQALAAVGAKYVMFIGSSAGGFASLRASVRFPASIAFVQDPQTDVGAYYSGHRNRLFECCWPQWEQDAALVAHPDRFDLRHLFATRDPQNFVYYRQSNGDEWHSRNHAKPFQEALKSCTGTRDGRFVFVFEDGEREGHGKITAAEFDRHFDAAQGFWREARATD